MTSQKKFGKERANRMALRHEGPQQRAPVVRTLLSRIEQLAEQGLVWKCPACGKWRLCRHTICDLCKTPRP